MPKTNINYSQGIVYKIVCNDLSINECYVGSTTNFSRRKAGHKNACNNEKNKQYNIYVYEFIRLNGGWNNWSMIEIQKYNCQDNNELKKYERQWIETLKAILNQTIPLRTQQEYYEENKEQQKQYLKSYRENNKEKIQEQQKQYYEDNKEQQKQYREKNKDKIKQYYEKNKDKILEQKKQYREENKDKIKEYYEDNKEILLEQQKQYYEDNKEILLEQQKQKIECYICKQQIRKDGLNRHEKTQKHLNNIVQ